MNFNSYATAIAYFMALLGLWAIGLVEMINTAFVAAASALTLASLFFNLRFKTVFPGWLWNTLAVVVFSLFLTDYLAVSGELITSASRFLTVLLILKLFDLNRNRDYLITYALVFFQVLASAASTSSISFLVILCLYVIAAIWAMIIFNIKKDAQELNRAGETPKGLFGLPFFFSIIALSALSISITLILFFTIPRMGVGFFERKTLNTHKVTGFSDTVDLGSIGAVKQDTTVIMRIEVNGKRPEGVLYFRGAALDSYDGRVWSRSKGHSVLLRKGSDGTFFIRKPYGDVIEQTILLEPLDTEFLFAASHAFRIEGRFPNLWLDPSASLRLPSPPYSRIEYKAWSSLSAANPHLPFDGGRYLDASYLNKSVEGQKITELARSLTAGAINSTEKAGAIEKHLKENYRYTLNPSQGKGAGPVEDFLFHAKEGYCEHYASAMVMLLRASGVPARIVTGFLQGEWNSIGNYYIVRQQDAHSWVEAYLDEGWTRFDPTPFAGVSPPGAPSRFSLYLDLMRLKWNRYIIHYSFDDQRKLAEDIKGRTSGLLDGVKGTLAYKARLSVKEAAPFLIIAAFIALLVLVLRGVPGARRSSRIPRFYIEMLSVLSKRGLSRRADETPLEFAKRTGSRDAVDITLAFNSERYGRGGITKVELEKVKLALEKLKKGA